MLPGKVCPGSECWSCAQGHKDWVIDRLGNRAICLEIFLRDDDFTVERLDRRDYPRFHECSTGDLPFDRSARPQHHQERSDCWRVSRNYFTVTPPWICNVKLVGTRAGQPLYIALDVELMIQERIQTGYRTGAFCPRIMPEELVCLDYRARNAV